MSLYFLTIWLKQEIKIELPEIQSEMEALEYLKSKPPAGILQKGQLRHLFHQKKIGQLGKS